MIADMFPATETVTHVASYMDCFSCIRHKPIPLSVLLRRELGLEKKATLHYYRIVDVE